MVAIGEALIDFTPSGFNDLGMALYSQKPGGAPINVLAMCSKLGGKTAFIGKISNDAFGHFLRQVTQNTGIDISNVVYADNIPTTLAFVDLDEMGNRSFSFCRKPGADICLRMSEINESSLSECRIFHFGSISLTDEPCRSATIESVKKARNAGVLISFDPNLEKGANKLLAYGASIVAITLGDKGSFCRNHTAALYCPAYEVPTVDTTGAGDAFWGAFLFAICKRTKEQIKMMSSCELKGIMEFSNSAGSLTVTKKGAIPAMPSRQEIETLTKSKDGINKRRCQTNANDESLGFGSPRQAKHTGTADSRPL